MASEQIAIRLPEQLLSELDALVAGGAYESRAAAVRAGIAVLARLERRRGIDQAIVRGYERVPQGRADDELALASLREAIIEEPW